MRSRKHRVSCLFIKLMRLFTGTIAAVSVVTAAVVVVVIYASEIARKR